MTVAGLQKLSLVDFPGKTAAVVFSQGCNFKCGYCQNPDLITTKRTFDITEKDVLDFLELRKDMLDAVVISGGEPTIQDDLPDFIRRVAGFGLEIKLDTNGSLPSVIGKLLDDRLIDYMAVDIKTSPGKYPHVTDQQDIGRCIRDSIGLTMSSDIPYEFRTTCVPGLLEEQDLHNIGDMVMGARKYILQQFRPEVTYDKTFAGIKKFSPQEINRFADILRSYVEEVGVRGV